MGAKSPWSFLIVVLLFSIPHFTMSQAARTAPGGIRVIPNTCAGEDLTAAENAISDASYLAKAGMKAAASWTQPPFSMFFDQTQWTSHVVYGVLYRVMRAQEGGGVGVGVTCQDFYGRCNSTAKTTQITPAYSVQYPGQHRMPQIIMCPAGLALPRDPEPCTEYPGGITLGWLMVHMMVHLKVISGSRLTVNDTGTGIAREVTEMVLMGQDTIGKASAYAYLGGWSCAVGLGGPRRPPKHQRTTCLENLRKGDRDATIHSNPQYLEWRNVDDGR